MDPKACITALLASHFAGDDANVFLLANDYNEWRINGGYPARILYNSEDFHFLTEFDVDFVMATEEGGVSTLGLVENNMGVDHLTRHGFRNVQVSGLTLNFSSRRISGVDSTFSE